MKKHTLIGAEIIGKMEQFKEEPLMQTAYEICRWHHERYGGTGYPDRLGGEDIAEIARIISVADAYDAMTSTRSYRDCLPQNVVREEIQRGRGRQFDPQFADIMLHIIDEDTSYELHE